jgi:Protein of unknown function (DUF3631)
MADDTDNIAKLSEYRQERAQQVEAAPLAETLDRVHAFLGRFVVYPSPEAHVAHVLWIAHTHCMRAWESTPRIAFLSPEPASGKTRALEVSELMVPNAVEAVNVSPAYLFRKVGDDGAKPTVLFDEIDAVFGPKAKDNEDVRALLNAGHRRGAYVGRCVVHGKIVKTEEIEAFCAVALAGLGWLPDTLLTRSVIVRMRRRGPDERVSPFRRRACVREGNSLRDQLGAWSCGAVKEMTEARPEMPEGIEDRNADVWEALLAVADAAGANWPERARTAAVFLVAAAADREPSLGVRLLADLREVFGDADQLTTAELLGRLHGLPEAPWNDVNKGQPINDRGLAFRLRQYEVKSRTLTMPGGARAKGYLRADLKAVWGCYLTPPPPSPQATVLSVPSVPNRALRAKTAAAGTATERISTVRNGSGTDDSGAKSPDGSTGGTAGTDGTLPGGDGGSLSDYDAVLEELAAQGNLPEDATP